VAVPSGLGSREAASARVAPGAPPGSSVSSAADGKPGKPPRRPGLSPSGPGCGQPGPTCWSAHRGTGAPGRRGPS